MFGFSEGKVKTVLKITDMHCSMCEATVNEAIRNRFDVKKVKSSAKKCETVIWSEEPLPEDELRAVIAETGYTLTDIAAE